MATDQNVNYRVGVKGAKKAGNQFKQLGKTILASFGGIFAAQKLAGLTIALKNAARDGEETRQKFDVVFEGMKTGANSVADAFSKSFKLAGATTRELLGNTGDLLVGFGFTEKAALDMAVQVNSLAQDLASFTNFSGGAKGASDALTKAILGETE